MAGQWMLLQVLLCTGLLLLLPPQPCAPALRPFPFGIFLPSSVMSWIFYLLIFSFYAPVRH